MKLEHPALTSLDMNKALTPTPVRSPCVKVCEMDEAVGLCKGCFRTQDERDWWVAYTDAQQREVLRRCELAPNMGPVEPKRKG